MASGSPRKRNPLPNRFFVAPKYIVWLRQNVGQQSAVAQLPSPGQPPPLAKKPKLKLIWKLVNLKN